MTQENIQYSMTIDANEAIKNVNFPDCKEVIKKNSDLIIESGCDAISPDLALSRPTLAGLVYT